MATVPVTPLLLCFPGLTWESWSDLSRSLPADRKTCRGSPTNGGNPWTCCRVLPIPSQPIPTLRPPSPSSSLPGGFQNHIWLPSELQLLKRTKEDRDGAPPREGSNTGRVALTSLSFVPWAQFEYLVSTLERAHLLRCSGTTT